MTNFRIFKLIKIKYNNMINTEFYINDYKVKGEDLFNKIIDILQRYKLSHDVFIKTNYQTNIRLCIIKFDFYQLINIIDKL